MGRNGARPLRRQGRRPVARRLAQYRQFLTIPYVRYVKVIILLSGEHPGCYNYSASEIRES
jgi:hypothetical protein